MATSNASPNTRSIFFYFGALTLLVYLVAPEYLLDIPTTYMLKNRLHATAPQVSMFRLLTGIPMYVAFLFGLTRDLWSPFGRRDRGFFLLFARSQRAYSSGWECRASPMRYYLSE